MAAPSLSATKAASLCDTLPPARLAPHTPTLPLVQSSPPSPPPVISFDPPVISPHGPHAPLPSSSTDASYKPNPVSVGDAQTRSETAARKLCVRHQRMADEGTNLKLQQALDALPVAEREAVSVIWSNFSSSPHPRRALILSGLLTMCCFSQLSLLTEQLAHLIRIDPFVILPHEVSLKVLGHLDATSLCRAAQVSRLWKGLADDDILWRSICEQHIGQKCAKCGWGLPILEKRRGLRLPTPPASASPCPSPAIPHSHPPPDAVASYSQQLKRRLDDEPDEHPGSSTAKRIRTDDHDHEDDSHLATPSASPRSPALALSEPPQAISTNPLLAPPATSEPRLVSPLTRPWKDVYCERLTIERNWRRGRCTVRTLKGHTDGVMCLQFSETLTHPTFPVLITGSYDTTARVWNLETGTEVHCLSGHSRAIRCLQFDEAKLITGSMDNTMRVWNWRTGQCLKVLEGHSEGVVSLCFDPNVLASGSVDTTVKVWNFRTGECFTLRGHCDWVNSVQLWDPNARSACDPKPAPTSSASDPLRLCSTAQTKAPQIDPGKMLFSGSDDGTIRLWDLCARTCVRVFKGHVGQVQSLKLLLVDEPAADGAEREGSAEPPEVPTPRSALASTLSAARLASPAPGLGGEGVVPPALSRRTTADGAGTTRQRPVLISGSLDNTIKVWDIDAGAVARTLFGHIEGVWAVASDKLRLVSGSHDRTIKVWSREEGSCTATLVGHRGAVTCLALGEDKIVSGSDDGDVRVWTFSG
ncbi:WD40 repeat-like protein [Epithele typhae]|uniref:WD40 repeat-like protein n=1 Tax=Epithele typhae TaxID=378194 RepID=UPI002007CCA4|nr:WD40 repeat-like protein [Epithele typhae]KAH9923993.1 WD40 repeat-like protein [Epithele typhae]